MNLGKKIINLRKKEKITQERLAELIGVTRQTISNWELNVTKPDINQIKEISKIFNISIDELVDNDIRDIIEKKISNTEELTHKTTKNLRIIIITIYFVILIGIITFTIYLLTKKDFTKKYQTEIYCTTKEGIIYNISLDATYNEETKKDEYFILVSEKESEKSGYAVLERIPTGNSLTDIFNDLDTMKKIVIADYGAEKCR